MRILIVAALVVTGCGGHCKEIAARKQALLARSTGAVGPHVEVRVPFARANAFIADMLHDQPLVAPLDVPKLGPFELTGVELSAVAREVRLEAARPEFVRFAIRLDIADHGEPFTTLDLTADVDPVLMRTPDATVLVTSFGPENLVGVTPVLGPDARAKIAEAIHRWVPQLPQPLLDAAADRFAEHLIGAAYKALQRTLLSRLGDVTSLKLRLPDMPIASTHVVSDQDALTIAIATDLPVRQGLAPVPAGSEISVRLSASTALELANWAIAHGRLPRHYTRSLKPAANGEYLPIFDYIATDKQRPVKIHVFQETGGCSYFGVGLWAYVGIEHDKLVASVIDQYVEDVDAGAPLELALGIKQLLLGATESTKRVVAHTKLTVGTRAFDTRITRAALTRDELQFDLALARQ